MKFKLGDIVNSSWNTYDKNAACEIDRIYTRKDNIEMLRLKFYHKGVEKRINVTAYTCKIDISYSRNNTLDQLGI
jgi:hypothetical protein